MTQSQRTPADYQAQLDEKRDRLTQLFADFNPPALEVHASPAEHYRMRAEFRIWHEGDDLFHCMYAQATKEIIRVDSFPTASLLINRLMPVLLAGLRPHPVLRRKLFQIDYLSTSPASSASACSTTASWRRSGSRPQRPCRPTCGPRGSICN